MDLSPTRIYVSARKLAYYFIYCAAYCHYAHINEGSKPLDCIVLMKE